MRVYEKKKKFQTFCRDQVKQGFMNRADGTWGKPVTATDQAAFKHMQAGYKLNR